MKSYLEMWPYFRDKYGCEDALESQYQELLAKDEQLRLSLAQIRNAQLAIEGRMAQLIEKEQGL